MFGNHHPVGFHAIIKDSIRKALSSRHSSPSLWERAGVRGGRERLARTNHPRHGTAPGVCSAADTGEGERPREERRGCPSPFIPLPEGEGNAHRSLPLGGLLPPPPAGTGQWWARTTRYMRRSNRFWRRSLFPNHTCHKIPAAKHLIHHPLQRMPFGSSSMMAQLEPSSASRSRSTSKRGDIIPSHWVGSVIVMAEGLAGVAGRVTQPTFHLPRLERQQRLQRLQIVTLNQPIPRVPLSCRPVGHLFQQTTGNLRRRRTIVVAGQPVQGRHGVLFIADADSPCR